MFSATIVTLDERAALVDLLAAARGSGTDGLGSTSSERGPSTGHIVMVRANRVIRRMTAALTPAVNAIGVDLAALAAAFGDRLHDAGMPVTPLQSQQCVRAIQERQPPSRRSLYYMTRAIFVTETVHLTTFNRVFADVFGTPAGADRHREQVADLTTAGV
ncbi:MAG: uncharacterized protein QOJ89_3460 [bacterium]|jgi:hypothetical protein